MRLFFTFLAACLMLVNTAMFTGCGNANNNIQNKETKNVSSNVNLDKKYYNKKFKFEVSYPGVWETYEEQDAPEMPDLGINIYIENNKDNYVRVYGQVSGIAIPEAGMTITDFVTDEEVKGKMYSEEHEGIISKHLVLNERYGANVKVSKEVYDKYEDVILKILKSIKIEGKP